MTDKSGWWAELTDSNGSKDVTRVKSVSPRWVRNDAGDCRITVARDDSLHDYSRVNAEMRLYRGDPEDEGVLFWRGFLHSTSVDGEDMTLSGPGVAHTLDEDAPDSPVTYTNIATWQAVEDYWDTHTSASATVFQPTPEQIASRDTVQSASATSEFDAITPSYPADKPVANKNGGVEVLQSVFFFEGEELNLDGTSTDSAASAGEHENIAFSGTSDSESFNLAYTIPEQYVEFGVRFKTTNGSDNEIEATIDGQRIGLFDGASYPSNYVGFNFKDNWTGGDLTAGSHTAGFGMVADNSGSVQIDAFFVYDTRFPPGFSNQLNSSGFLEEPQLYPAAPTVEFDNQVVNFNLTKGYLDIATPDTAGIGKLQISFDEGGSYAPTDGSEQNTTSVAATQSGSSRDIRGRVQLEGYGTRTSPAPATGFNPGRVDSWDLQADGNDLSVIDELTLTRSNLENLQELHENGNFQWTIEHSSAAIGNLTVVSYQEGDETRTTPSAYDNPIEKQSSVDATSYYNALYLRGAEDSNGNYPTAEVEDTQEINEIGDRIDTSLTDPTITTDAGAKFRAEALLSALTDENDRRGEITIPLRSSVTHPGYARSIDFGGGSKLKTIEEVRLREGTDGVEQTHVYTPPDNVADEIEQLRREARRQRD